MSTRRTRRCKRTGLTQSQARLLALVAMSRGHYDPVNSRRAPWHNGVARSLVARGLLAAGHRSLTETGIAALKQCIWFTPGMFKYL